ncbi:MAG: methyltransferase family protein, partial [Anaerolineae bacterium]
IYALIRHPLYLGWILVYTGVMAVGQYCLTVLLCLLGIGCVSVICRQEDRRLLERFGSRYEAYLDSVPAMNLVAGLMRWISRKRQARQKSTRDDEQEPKTA